MIGIGNTTGDQTQSLQKHIEELEAEVERLEAQTEQLQIDKAVILSSIPSLARVAAQLVDALGSIKAAREVFDAVTSIGHRTGGDKA